MWLSAVSLHDFRCFKSLTLSASEDLNILVGENNVGKTSLFIAVSKLINAIWPKTEECFEAGDLRQARSTANQLSVTCTFSLDANDKRDMLDLLSPKDFDRDAKRLLKHRMDSIAVLHTLEVSLQWPQQPEANYIRLGPLYIQGNNALTPNRTTSGSTVPLHEATRSLVSPEYSKTLEMLMHGETNWADNGLRKKILTTLTPKFSFFSEYRGKPGKMQRTTFLESLQGSQTANVLLNLKNHTDRQQRHRYTGIKYAFSTFFPHLTIEAVEAGVGSNIADIQFTQIGGSLSLPTENVGAGVLELLTLLTNLVTLRCHIFVIEEPELHLHPHMKRNLAAFIRHSSIKNQVFVITHDPIFIDPDSIFNLNRFYSAGKTTGTLIASMSTSTDLSPKDIGQIRTASRDVLKREMCFARAVLFVEDESQQNFIEACADKLDLSPDSLGISIVAVAGSKSFQPYIRLAEQLEIPFLCLADLPWGPSPDKPPNTYRSLGCELEEYLEQAGCGSLIKQARRAVGTSKQRVAKHCGESIPVSSIPVFIRQLLDDMVKLSKTHHKNKQQHSSVSSSPP